MSRCVIYALVDELGHPHYVGQTQKLLSTRLSQHRSAARGGRHRALEAWLRATPTASIVPLEVAPADPDEAERRWISQMRATGIALLNIAPGGRRNAGVPRSPEAIEKTMSKLRGRRRTPEQRAKLSQAHRGVPLSPRHRAAISKGMKGIVFSPEHRDNLSKSKRGELNPMSATRRAARAGEVMP